MSSLRFAHVCAHSHLQYARKCVLLSYSGEGEERRERREERGEHFPWVGVLQLASADFSQNAPEPGRCHVAAFLK